MGVPGRRHVAAPRSVRILKQCAAVRVSRGSALITFLQDRKVDLQVEGRSFTGRIPGAVYEQQVPSAFSLRSRGSGGESPFRELHIDAMYNSPAGWEML